LSCFDNCTELNPSTLVFISLLYVSLQSYSLVFSDIVGVESKRSSVHGQQKGSQLFSILQLIIIYSNEQQNVRLVKNKVNHV